MSIDYRALAVGPLQTNCYIVWDRETRKAAIIDPGSDFDLIVAEVDSLGLSVEWVLLTHGHFDHAFYAGPVAERYGAKIGMQALDVGMLTQSLAFAEPFCDASEFAAFTPTDYVDDGDEIELGLSKISILHTPGHSQGGVCYVTDAGVFCGDTIFAGSVGRSDFPGGSHEQLISSIRTKILTMDDATPLYPGHGPATTVGDERRGNWFLQ